MPVRAGWRDGEIFQRKSLFSFFLLFTFLDCVDNIIIMANSTTIVFPNINLPHFDSDMLSLDIIPPKLQVPFAVAVSSLELRRSVTDLTLGGISWVL
jgi:hypothetical protein